MRAELAHRGLDPEAVLPDDVVERMEQELREQEQRAGAAAVIAQRVEDARTGPRRNEGDSDATIEDDDEY